MSRVDHPRAYIAFQQFKQFRVKKLLGIADLGQSHREPSLGTVQFARFVSTAIAVALTAFIALAADNIRLLRLQAFLHHEGGGHTHELTERCGSMVRRSHILKKRPNLFAKPISRLYVLHDSVNSFLPRAGSKGFDRFLLGRDFTLFLFAENL